MFRWCSWWVLGICGWLLACSDDDDPGAEGVVLQGNTACERWSSLATAKGCAAVQDCVGETPCETQAKAYVDCAATDLAQCLCESDGSLNCEGAYKANEGPARCVAEMEAFSACRDGE